MVGRRCSGLAAVLAALAAVPPVVFAQSQSDELPGARSDRWALLGEPAARDSEQALRSRSPAGADTGWLRSAEFKPAVQVGLAQGWALCADWDRYRPKAVQVKESIDTFLLGLQYKFP